MRQTFKRIMIFLYLLILTLPYKRVNAQQTILLQQCWQQAIDHYTLYHNMSLIDSMGKIKQNNLLNQWKPSIELNSQATYQSDGLNLHMLIPDISTQPITFLPQTIETPLDQYKIYINIQQPIYRGGIKKYAKESEKISTQIDLLQNNIELRKLIEQINQLYFQILIFRKKIELQKLIVNTLEEKEKSVLAAVKMGILQEKDVNFILIEKIKAYQILLENQFMLKTLYENFKDLTQIEVNDSILLKLPDIKIDSIKNIKKIEIISFENQNMLFESAKNMIHSQRKPNIIAFAQAGYGRPALNMLSTTLDPYYIVGISLRWTIYDWHSMRNNQQLIFLQQQKLKNQQQAFEQNLRLTQRISETRIEQLKSSLKNDSLIMQLRKQITLQSSLKLDKGLITSVDYINDLNAEQQAVLQYETNKILYYQEKINHLLLNGTIETLVLQNEN